MRLEPGDYIGYNGKKERLPRKKKKEVKRDIVRWCEYYGLRVPKFTMEMLNLYYFEKL